jgi:hypothetical protein
MKKLWQLKKLSDGSALSEPQKLPENWGPIFGLHGFIDKIGDLSWIGDEYKDMGWFIVGDAPADLEVSTKAEIEWERAKQLLRESDWAVMPDVPMLEFQRTAWVNYRKALRDIRLHPDFPNMTWPAKPE